MSCCFLDTMIGKKLLFKQVLYFQTSSDNLFLQIFQPWTTTLEEDSFEIRIWNFIFFVSQLHKDAPIEEPPATWQFFCHNTLTVTAY